MKKITFLLLILWISSFNAQNYSFDFLTKYISTSSDPKITDSRDLVTYFNTDDFSYYLTLRKTSTGFYGYLTDENRKTMHKFDVTEEQKDGEIEFSFNYTGTRKLSGHPVNLKKVRIQYEEMAPDSVKLKIFKNESATKPEREYLLKLKKANKNLFPIARIVMMHPYEAAAAVDFGRNIVVEKASDICIEKRCNCDITLAEYKNVELDLQLPKELKFIIY